MRIALFLYLCVFCAGLASAQSHGYAFIAPGGFTSGGHTNSIYQIGAGGEGVFSNGIGIGAEAGYVTSSRRFGGGFGLGSANGSYHFNHRARLVPFVTGGYTLAFNDGTANLVNFGAGVNWWLRPHVGMKFEFRDHIHRDNFHIWGFRFGFTFR